jgi:hypothetical protein
MTVVSTAEWQSKLQKRIDSVPSRVVDARRTFAEIGPWLHRYHGGMPMGFLAAIAQWESGGKMSSTGDAVLGEVGYFQITSTFPPKVSVPAAKRYEPEVNVFLGCLEYQIEAVRMKLHHPLVSLGSSDSWKLARLAFAIGTNGTQQLITAARPWAHGRVFEAVRRYVDEVGGVSLGRQSAGKVWYRVHSVDLQWQIGQQVFPYLDMGAPVKIPAPPETPYTLPADVAPHLPSPLRGPLVAAGLVGLSFLV